MLTQLEQSPLLVAVVMVKNEAHSIEKTLFPFVINGVKHICILDTGSTDNTIDVVKNFFQIHEVDGYIDQEPFVDFSTSRNRALELAESYFPNSQFMIMPDADWCLENTKHLLKFLENRKDHTDEPLYYLPISSKAIKFSTPRLFRTASKNRFVGVVHEVPKQIPAKYMPGDVYFRWEPTNIGIEKSQQRWHRDAELLLKAHEQDPTNPRTAFYLAQSYDCLEEFETALKYYQIREQLNGWDEENFMTVFRIGTVLERLSLKENSQYTWEMALGYYLKAFGMRPHRIEPLVRIADYYWYKKNIPACFMHILYTYHMPYPTDHLFVEKAMYDYLRYEIMSRCAWYMQEYELGKEATLRALNVCPDTPHLKQNLSLYESKCPRS